MKEKFYSLRTWVYFIFCIKIINISNSKYSLRCEFKAVAERDLRKGWIHRQRLREKKKGEGGDKIVMQKYGFSKRDEESSGGPLRLHSTNKIIRSDDPLAVRCVMKKIWCMLEEWTVRIRRGEQKSDFNMSIHEINASSKEWCCADLLNRYGEVKGKGWRREQNERGKKQSRIMWVLCEKRRSRMTEIFMEGYWNYNNLLKKWS